MGLLSYLRGSKGEEAGVKDENLKKIREVIDICDPQECGGLCSADEVDEEDAEALKKDESVFAKLKIDEEALYGSSRASKIHFIVPTSQTDWEADACMERKGSLQYQLNSWVGKNGAKYPNAEGPGSSLLCSVSSLPIDMLDIEVMRNTKNDVLIMPHFLKLKSVKADNIESILEEIVPLLLHNDREALLAKPYVEETMEDSFIFLCSHKTRDKRCGITAPILEKHFNKHLKRHGLYRDNSDFRPNGCRVGFVNHVGGHKFAANVIIYLRKTSKLIWLGRVTPLHAETIIDCIIVPDIPKLPYPEKVRCVEKFKY